ncbi:MAG: OsmC family protein [Pseudomonadota bacterium]
MTTQIQKSFENGVDIAAIREARTALGDSPEAGQFVWRAACEWIDGIHSRSTIEGFYGLGEELKHDRTFTIDADHPPQFAAADQGATPVEIVLSALASCLTGGVASIAANRGIHLNSAKTIVEGDMDLAGVMGIDPAVRNGFSEIRVRFEIDADATEDEIAALVAQSQKRSAVFDIITNPGSVQVEAQKVNPAQQS